MIAKIVKGRSFKGVVGYILDPAKQASLLSAEGVRANSRESIVRSFVAQAGMNPRISKPVCHVSLSFSPQDKDKLTDEGMVRVACDYMARMGFVNTQFFIARHFDKEHPHVHIVFNRIGNDGKTISDQNDRIRSERICKELTRRYGLHFAAGKGRVNEQRLREPDKTKYEIYNALKVAVSRCKGWPELADVLQRQGISVELVRNGDTDKIQGVRFSKNGYLFNGSKIDRKFSYSKIDAQLRQNEQGNEVRNIPTQVISPVSSQAPALIFQPGDAVLGSVAHNAAEALFFGAEAISGLGGLFDTSPQPPQGEDVVTAEERIQRKKKKKGIKR